jgi:phage baseplate assembly protein W
MAGLNKHSGHAIGDLAHIQQSVADVLTTPLGSRLMRRDYGSEIPALIDQPLNGATRLRVMAATATALKKWEPRIRAQRVTLELGQQHGALSITLEAERIDGPRGQQPVALSIPLRA